MREIKIGRIYKHFKNKYYLVIDIVNDCESNNDDVYKKIIIYKALYGEFLTWARPYEMFASEVDHNKYPDVKQKYRFEEIDIDCYRIKNSISTHNMVMDAEIVNLKYELMRRDIQSVYAELIVEYGEMCLDDLLHKIYQKVNFDNMAFSDAKNLIITTLNIDEIAYYTRDVNPNIIAHVRNEVFPEYELNDKAHGITHVMEVIRRSFALNETFNLGLDPDLVYVIAAYHDLGKHEDHDNHHKIAAQKFLNDKVICSFFNDAEITAIAEAIEDHRSSNRVPIRSVYGNLVSSADRNTSVNMVFIRSFFVAQERMPESTIEDYLNFTIDRLSKRYARDPENMIFKDSTYNEFLVEIRELLRKPEQFKNRYCDINNIGDRSRKVSEYEGYVE
jgi:uncharacterized protein